MYDSPDHRRNLPSAAICQPSALCSGDSDLFHLFPLHLQKGRFQEYLAEKTTAVSEEAEEEKALRSGVL